MPSFSRQLSEAVLDLMWSMWTELGVPGVKQRHQEVVIDPEPLILLTALHGDLDPRLRDESLDWVVRFGTYVSKVRLKNLLDDWSVSGDRRFAEYAATVNAHARLGWPTTAKAKPLQLQPRARFLIEDFRRPSLLALRLRAIFGVGARAELLRIFLAQPQIGLSGSELSVVTSYRKRNVQNALESLRLAGIVKAVRVGNATRYFLEVEAPLSLFVANVPKEFPRWSQLLRVFHLLLELAAQTEKMGEVSRIAAAQRFLREHRDELEASGIDAPSAEGFRQWQGFVDWALWLVRWHARSQGAG